MRAAMLAAVLACYDSCLYMTYRADNPYPLTYEAMILLLLVGFVLWRRIRPPAVRLLRAYASVGATVAVVLGAIQTTEGLPCEVDVGCRLVLHAAVLVAASLYLEIFLWWRHRRQLAARAIARYRARRISGTSAGSRAA